MSTVVQTNHVHESPTTLTLKLSSNPSFQTQIERSRNSHSCWDFPTLTTSASTHSSSAFYVPPKTNKSLPTICLELCTENLGSESGSDTSDILPLLVSTSTPRQQQQPKQSKKEKMTHPPASRSFPPPLTTIRGANPIRVRPKREGGRLVIEAVEEPKPCAYFRSQRSHGHLRLCFWDNHEDQQEEEGNCDDQDQIEEEEEEEEDGLNARVEIGSQKFERRSRCKEGRASCNNSKAELCNWKPFLVAT